MPFDVFLTTSWNTRGKAAKALKALDKYTTTSKITVVQNGLSNKPMNVWLKEETGVSNFEFNQIELPAFHGTIWNWCMNNALYRWVVILNDSHYPTSPWELFLETLTRKFDHSFYLLDGVGGTEAFAIDLALWQKMGFSTKIWSRRTQIYHTFLRAGFMKNAPTRDAIFKSIVFPYFDHYGEPLFVCDEDDTEALRSQDIKELEQLWRLSNKEGSIEGPDFIKRVPVFHK